MNDTKFSRVLSSVRFNHDLDQYIREIAAKKRMSVSRVVEALVAAAKRHKLEEEV